MQMATVGGTAMDEDSSMKQLAASTTTIRWEFPAALTRTGRDQTASHAATFSLVLVVPVLVPVLVLVLVLQRLSPCPCSITRYRWLSSGESFVPQK
jgi:hypothetical protein